MLGKVSQIERGEGTFFSTVESPVKSDLIKKTLKNVTKSVKNRNYPVPLTPCFFLVQTVE